MINVSNIRKTYAQKTAVDIASLHIKAGEIIGLVGNNGAGKSTLFRLMLDLVKCDDDCGGIITNDGSNVHSTEEWKGWTGAFLDDSFLIDYLTAEEYFTFISRVSGTEADMEQLSPILADVDRRTLIRNLSAGNRQKVGIASAMMTNPKLLILDEPFNFLDPSSQNALKKILLEYNRNTGATILLSSHNLQHTVEISSRILLMEHGSIIKDIENNNRETIEQLNTYFL